MRNNQPAIGKHVVAYQAVEKRFYLGPKLGSLRLQLSQRLSQTVCYLYVSARKHTQQFYVVVARYADTGSGIDHSHHQPEYIRRVRPSIYKISQENGLSAGRRYDA